MTMTIDTIVDEVFKELRETARAKGGSAKWMSSWGA